MKRIYLNTVKLILNKGLIILFVLIVLVKLSFSQKYIEVKIIQPVKLQANAGNDTNIVLGNYVVLGGKPSATGGKSSYSYLWTPATGLNDSTISNPTATPTKTTLYRLVVKDANGCTDSSSIRVSLPGNSISGVLKYDNTNLTPLNKTDINLVNLEGIKLNKSTTDVTGKFVFNNVTNGSYILEPDITKPWGGGNPVDALIVNRSYIGLYVFKDLLYKKAADVSNDGKRNPTDALMINRRYIGLLNSFKSGNWFSENDTIKVQSLNLTHDIKAVCFGDVNGSYTPGAKRLASTTIANDDILTFSKDKIIDLPLRVTRDVVFGAIGLKLKFTNSNLQLSDVLSNIEGLIFKIVNDGVNIAWAVEKEGILFKAGEPIVMLRIKYIGDLGNNINSPLEIEPESILADDNIDELFGEILSVPKLFNTDNNKISNVSASCYPNPFSQSTVISYQLSEKSFVSIKVFDILGNEVRNLDNSEKDYGSNKIEFDAKGLEAGIYYYRIYANDKFTTGKMVLMK